MSPLKDTEREAEPKLRDERAIRVFPFKFLSLEIACEN